MAASKVVVASGKRKSAIARAVVRPGKGKVMINAKLLDYYEPQMARMKLQEPLLLAGESASKVDFEIDVKGGGTMGQAEAARLMGITQPAICQYKKNIFSFFSKKYLL